MPIKIYPLVDFFKLRKNRPVKVQKSYYKLDCDPLNLGNHHKKSIFLLHF